MTGIADLAWDSSFFGFPIARVTGGVLTSDQLDDVVAQSRKRGVRCLYLLAEDDRTSLLAQERDFRMCDVRITLDRRLDGVCGERAQIAIGRACPEQRQPLDQCVRERFEASRFFTDPRFSNDQARDLFSAFLERGFDAGDRVTLTDADARGFVICHMQPERGTGSIELIGVVASAEGTGLAEALMHAAHNEFIAAGLGRSEVVTQARNVSAQRLYQRLGYRTRESALWLHRWFA